MFSFSHDDLVHIAARWLWNKQRCPLVITEMTSGSPETPDAIGWTAGGMSIMVECKTSRSDFLADRDKWFRNPIGENRAMGTFRWYLTPPGLLLPCEIKGHWGLIEAKGRSVIEVVPAHAYTDERRHEFSLLTSTIRRMSGHPGVQGMRVRIYTADKGTGPARAALFARCPAKD